MANENNNIQATTDDSQIVLYQPDESISVSIQPLFWRFER